MEGIAIRHTIKNMQEGEYNWDFDEYAENIGQQCSFGGP